MGLFFFARNSQIESSVSWRVVVVQYPIVCNVARLIQPIQLK